jgi:hypothetical protein
MDDKLIVSGMLMAVNSEIYFFATLDTSNPNGQGITL